MSIPVSYDVMVSCPTCAQEVTAKPNPYGPTGTVLGIHTLDDTRFPCPSSGSTSASALLGWHKRVAL